MKRYYNRYWKEEGINYYFETDLEGFPIRQIEIWDNGKILKYDEKKSSDKDGFLADKPLDIKEFSDFEIDKIDFEKAWQTR